MIVVTGSARTGTSLMMRILKELGYKVPAPQFFEEPGGKMEKFNPDGFYEIAEDQETGIQDHRYKGMAVKLFGYALEKTPGAFVSKVIVCRRDRTAAIKSSIPVFETLYSPNQANNVEDVLYDAHFRFVEQFLGEDTDSLDVLLENMQADPDTELQRICGYLGITADKDLIKKITDSIHRTPLKEVKA